MSFLASSIFGHEFINYRKNVRDTDRKVFSYNVRQNFPGMIPVVIDSVDQNLSLALNNCDTTMPERMWKYGKEYTMSVNTTVDEVLKEINKNIYIIGKKLILGLEDGTLLKGHEDLGQIYKKNKNQKDQILYLLLTQETTIYGYILSILRYLGILAKIDNKDKIIIKRDDFDTKNLKEESNNACFDYLYEINNKDYLDQENAGQEYRENFHKENLYADEEYRENFRKENLYHDEEYRENFHKENLYHDEEYIENFHKENLYDDEYIEDLYKENEEDEVNFYNQNIDKKFYKEQYDVNDTNSFDYDN
jgi:hypothetical protein